MLLGRRRRKQKLELLLQCIRDLRRYQARISQEAFLGSRDLQYQPIFPRTLGVKAAAELGAWTLAERRLPPSKTHADTFRALAESGLINPGLGARLAEAAQARNFLLHGKGRLDAERAWAAMAQEVDDLEAFAKALT